MAALKTLRVVIEQGLSTYLSEEQPLEVFRVVESQQRMATAHLVDDPDEQYLLEQLLEESKPGHAAITEGWHYLIATPFRYPPLKYGSRFGEVTEPALFYAADSFKTAFDEVAFYRYKFLYEDMDEPIEGTVRLQYTVFGVRLNRRAFVSLTQTPFKEFRAHISHPSDYQTSRALGCAMRESGVASFDYFSVRAKVSDAINYGVFDYHDLAKKPRKQEQWNAFVNRTKFAVIQEDFRQRYEVTYAY